MNKIRKTLLLIAAFFCFAGVYSQQKIIIRGHVIDKKDKSPLIGANIIEYGKDNRTLNGTICDMNGNFVLELIDRTNRVKVSMIGYKIQEIKGDLSKPITILLETSDQLLDEVQITGKSKGQGLTNIDERDNASSRVKIDLQEMKDGGILSASDALQGKVSGLDIITSSGDPGSGSQLVIRGLSSMGNAKPLIVIDGIPQFSVPTDFNLSSAGTEEISNLINIAVKDIKSVEILKDGASTAQYGSRGADGVLIIETRKGKKGKVQFDYSYKASMNYQPPPIPMLNGDEYIMLQLEEWHNNRGIFDIPQQIAYDKDYYDFYNYSANTDWIGAITQNSLTNDHYFNVSGGGDKTRFFTSLSYIDEGGTTINTSSKRFSTRMNLDYFLSKKLVFSIQFNYTNNNTDGSLEFDKGDGSGQKRTIREMAYMKAPNMSIWEYDENGRPTGEYFTPINSYQGAGSVYFNPVAVANLGKKNKLNNSLQNTFILKYNLLDWLNFRETVSFQFYGEKTKEFLPYNAAGNDWLQWNINRAAEGNSSGSSINTESQIAFDSPFRTKTHYISGTFNLITNQSDYEWLYIEGIKTPSTNIQDPSVSPQIGWTGNGSGEGRDIGLLTNLNYKLLDRYVFQSVIRADAASAFGSNNRWGIFQGLSVGWRFSDETFMKAFPFLGESMIRASYGVSGRQPNDPYARFATYNTSGNYMTSSAIIPTQVQLNNLQWETITSYDLGLKLNLFNDRLYIDGDIYRKITNNILFDKYNIPTSSGYDQLKFFNGGELTNDGWELMMEYKIIQTNDFLLSFNFNASYNVNSFTGLPQNFNTEKSTSIDNGEYPKRIVTGEPIGSFFGFRYKGVYASDKDAVARDAQGNIIYENSGYPLPLSYAGTYNFKGGDAIYEDVNHDGKIDLNDVVYIGDSNPDLTGGFGTSAKYKNLDISCSFHYRLGFDIINGVAIQTQGMNDRNNQSKAVLSRWRAQGQSEPGMLPRAYLIHPANNLGSDRYVEKGDFLRLLNVTINYKLNQKYCDMLKIRTLNVGLSLRKFLTFTTYTGQDPEVGQDATDPFWIGIDYARTPPPKIMTFSIAIGF